MVRDSTRRVGNRGEDAALQYLLRHGLEPIHRNFRCRRGEVDLIMRDGAQLVFVEVRSRTANSFVDAVHTVDARKQKKLISTAAIFLARNQRFGTCVCRFDVLGIDKDAAGEVSFMWLQDAFRPVC